MDFVEIFNVAAICAFRCAFSTTEPAGAGNQQAAANALVAIHVVKSTMVMNGSLQSKIYATIFGLAAEIERDFIVQRADQRRLCQSARRGRAHRAPAW